MVSLKLRDHDAANAIRDYRLAAALAAESREGGCIIGSLIIQKIQTTLRLRDSLMETVDFAPMSRAIRMNICKQEEIPLATLELWYGVTLCPPALTMIRQHRREKTRRYSARL